MSNLIFHTTGNVAGLLLRLTVVWVVAPAVVALAVGERHHGHTFAVARGEGLVVDVARHRPSQLAHTRRMLVVRRCVRA